MDSLKNLSKGGWHPGGAKGNGGSSFGSSSGGGSSSFKGIDQVVRYMLSSPPLHHPANL
jgi:hypothetical protein